MVIDVTVFFNFGGDTTTAVSTLLKAGVGKSVEYGTGIIAPSYNRLILLKKLFIDNRRLFTPAVFAVPHEFPGVEGVFSNTEMELRETRVPLRLSRTARVESELSDNAKVGSSRLHRR